MVSFSPPAADNRQPRCPCVLVLDTSGSMSGERIQKLNAALASLPAEFASDPLATKRVEVAIVTFPPVKTQIEFCNVDEFSPPVLRADGGTPLGSAVLHALQLIEGRKAYYRQAHLQWYRPWIFLITDGVPDAGDDWRAAAAAVRHAESNNKVAFFAVAVPGADLSVLAEFSKRRPRLLLDLRFREMFEWLTSSLKSVANSNTHSGGDPKAAVSLPQTMDWSSL